KPSAPLPANRSMQRRPSRRCPSQLKRVSRTRSGVGRRPCAGWKRTRRLRHSPPMMRTRLRPAVIVAGSYRKMHASPPRPMSSREPKKEKPASGWRDFLRKDLELTRSRWKGALDVLRARPKIDEQLFADLEAQLIEADVGIAATAELVARLRKAQRDR